MNLKESMLYNAGSIEREEYLMAEEYQLLEGIKMFKVSGRIEKTVDSLQKKMKKVEDEDQKKALKSLVDEMQGARDEFDDLEQRYSDSKEDVDKEDLKKQYNQVKKKYTSMLNKVSKDNIKKALIGAGAMSLVLGSLAALHAALGGEIPKGVESMKDKIMSGSHSPMGVNEKDTESLLKKLQSGAKKMNLDQVSKIGSRPGAL